MICMIFFGDLVSSVVSILKQTRNNSPRRGGGVEGGG